MDAIKDSPALQHMLLAGGLTAGATGLATLASENDPNETPFQHRMRALRNAAGGGALAAGTTGLLEQGYGHLARPLPVGAVDPVAKGLHNATHGLAARGAAMSGMAAWPIMAARGESNTAQESIRRLMQGKDAQNSMSASGMVDYANDFVRPNKAGVTAGLGELFSGKHGDAAKQALQEALASEGSVGVSKVDGMLRDAGLTRGAGIKNLFTKPELASDIKPMIPRAFRGPAIAAAAFAPEIISKGMDLVGRGVSSNLNSDPDQAPTS